VVKHADELLARRGHQPLPLGVTAHKLRHTFASILYVRGEDPPYVMAQLGHTDPGFTLRVYVHAMRRDEGDKERSKALVEGRDWAPMGTERPDQRPDAAADQEPETTKLGQMQGLPVRARRVSNLRSLACEGARRGARRWRLALQRSLRAASSLRWVRGSDPLGTLWA
jgi:hypothetical protein